MRRITLRSTSLQTSALGFGCGRLDLNDRAKAVALLNEALDLGITHFDTAPAYGFGQAEGILCEFLRGKRDRVTVTTKFGLQFNAAAGKHRRLISIARKIVHTVPGLRTLGRRASQSMVRSGAFSPTAAADSLTKSLAALGTDHIDIFLLHDGTLPDAQRDDLIDFLNGQVSKGTIRYHGVAGEFHTLPKDFSLFPASMKVFQFDSSVAKPHVSQLTGGQDRGLITFGVLPMALPLSEAAMRDASLSQRYSQLIGRDLRDPATVRDLLVHQAMSANPDGIVIFSTSRSDHLRENVKAVDSPAPSPEALAHFADYARRAMPAGTTSA